MSDNQRKISSFFGLGAKKKAAAPAVAPNQVGATAKGSPSASAGTGNSGGSSASPSRKRPADATEGAAGEQPAAKKKATEQQTTAPPGDPKVIAAILESRVNQFTNKYIETIAAEGGAKAEGKEEPQVVAGAGAAAGGGAGSDQDAGTAKPLDTGGVRAVRHWNFGNESMFVVSQGSVVDFKGDAIVNAANEMGLGGGGVDGAINAAGGEALYAARKAMPVTEYESYGYRRRRRIKTGSAVATPGKFGKLRCNNVIHAVGPNYNDVDDSDVDYDDKEALLALFKPTDILLKRAYAKKLGCKTVGFSLISAGIFSGERGMAAVLRLAVQMIKKVAYPGLQVHMVAYTDRELRTLVQIASKVFNPPNPQTPQPVPSQANNKEGGNERGAEQKSAEEGGAAAVETPAASEPAAPALAPAPAAPAAPAPAPAPATAPEAAPEAAPETAPEAAPEAATAPEAAPETPPEAAPAPVPAVPEAPPATAEVEAAAAATAAVA